MLKLPPADHTPLEHPPLPLVVAQARFSSPVQEITQDVVARFQAGLLDAGFALDRVVSVEVGDVVIGPGARPTPTDRLTGVQLTSEDGEWMVTLLAGSVSLETPSFSSFSGQFGPLLAQVLRLATDVLDPVMLTRAGLRFVNVLHRPEAEGDWSRWVRPSLVAAQGDELLGSGLVSQTQQLLFDVAAAIKSAVRAGSAEVDGKEGFLLDIDTFSEPAALWLVGNVASVFDDLNASGVALFQALVTPEMLSRLGSGDTNVEAGQHD
jgi:uncharacterized protein (TIGR04255 family)